MALQNLITLTESKNKFIVPQYNGVALHSVINPQKEAESLANNYMSQLTKSPYVIILGLGFGYHVDEIYKLMKLKHEQPQIIVIEAISELIKVFKNYKGFDYKNVSILNYSNPNEIFFDELIVHSILSKPTVIIHPGSFNSNQTYYRTFLSKRANKIEPQNTLARNILGANV
jgi:hypothetical protein